MKPVALISDIARMLGMDEPWILALLNQGSWPDELMMAFQNPGAPSVAGLIAMTHAKNLWALGDRRIPPSLVRYMLMMPT